MSTMDLPEPGQPNQGDRKPGRPDRPAIRKHRASLGVDQPADGHEAMGVRDLRPFVDAGPMHPQNDRSERVANELDRAIDIEQSLDIARTLPAVCVARAKRLLEADVIGLLTPVFMGGSGDGANTGDWSPAFDLVQAEIAAGIRDIFGEPYPHYFADTELEHEPAMKCITQVRVLNGEA